MKLLYKTGLMAVALSAVLSAQAQTTPTEGEQIDLGLSVDWRGYNIGATSPAEKGDTYAFASLRKNMNPYTYEYQDQSTGYYTFPLENISGNPQYDAAAATTDGKWRMPTREQWEELAANCTSTRTNLNGVSGFMIVSKINGNSIFIPEGANLYGYYNFFLPKAIDQNMVEMACANSLSYPAYMFSQTNRNMSPARGLHIRPVCDHYAGPALEDIEVSCDKSDIFAGTTTRISVTLIPAEVPVSIVFSSSDENIATVDKDGVVSGIANGTAEISVKAGDIIKTVTVKVTEVETDYTEAVVDLGLSVKWAAWNLGATSVKESGDAYPWGYIEAGDLTIGQTYKWCGIANICGNPEYDAVTKESNGAMQLPGKAEYDELLEKCHFVNVTIDGVDYVKGTSSVNGKSILFPIVKKNSYTIRAYASGSANVSLKKAWVFYTSDLSVRESSSPSSGMVLRGIIGDVDVPTLKSVAIEPSEVKVYEENSTNLTIVATPVDASVEDAVWTSSDESVATVDAKGKVNGLKAGTAEITVTAGGISATATVTVEKVELCDDDAVDMGVSVKWSRCELGAETPADNGLRYRWATTTAAGSMEDDVTQWKDPNILDISGTTYDVATKTLGKGWHIPTWSELSELAKNTEFQWITYKGRRGVLLTSTINGNKIFCPRRTSDSGYNQYNNAIVYPSSRQEIAEDQDKEKRNYVLALVYDNNATSIDPNNPNYLSVGWPLPVRAVFKSGTVAVESIDASDDASLYDVINLQGVVVRRNADEHAVRELAPGVYIIRSATETRKILVR